ncbi:MAG: hypothetical protein QOK28_3590 [Actinomycetota bacterium]|jgi:hypothetical protein
MKRCARCGEEKLLSEFSWKSKATGRLSSICKYCARAKSGAHYASNKAKYVARAMRRNRLLRSARAYAIVEYLSTHPCVDCGEADPLVLEFDHRRDKEFTIGRDWINRSWADVLAEIEKCEVRCANCHRRRTAQAGGYLRFRLVEER